MAKNSCPIVCIVGGAVAGSEAAACLAEAGIPSVVIDMGATPWGKIELGLPKWHARQRDQEEARINQNLSSPLVHYLPLTRVGSDLSLAEIQEMGFSAVLLAMGAWKDRPLDIPGIDAYQGRGFHYQNSYVACFNQYHDAAYSGRQLEVEDDAIVIGGGLASLDVVKILMLESTLRALAERGHRTDLFTLEKKGIPKVLEGFGLSWDQLGLKGCTLYYRRRAQDMPLIPLEDTSTHQKQTQAEKVRQKLLENFLAKYLFEFRPCCLPVDKIVEGDRLTGLVFQSTEVASGRATPLPGTEFEVRSPLVISSIGSVPQGFPGLGTDHELLRIADPTTGRLEGFENIFALGNAVTGRGNIRASRIHSRQVAGWVIDEFLGWKEGMAASAGPGEEEQPVAGGSRVKTPAEMQEILDRVSTLQRRVGYHGDLLNWVARHTPVRFENL